MFVPSTQEETRMTIRDVQNICIKVSENCQSRINKKVTCSRWGGGLWVSNRFINPDDTQRLQSHIEEGTKTKGCEINNVR